MSQTERALDEDADDLDDDQLDDDVADVELFDDETDDVAEDDDVADGEVADGGITDALLVDDDEDRLADGSGHDDDVDVVDEDDVDGVGVVDDVDVEDDVDGVDVVDDVDVEDDVDGVDVVDDVDVDVEDDVDVDVEEVADADVLEELRRADIDGPTVAPVPEDDASPGLGRRRRASDYDDGPVPVSTQVPRLLGYRPRVRRVTRVVRHVDPWSVFKIAIVGNLVLYVILLTAGVLLWNVAHATGTVDNVERFFESFGWSEFEFNGGEIFHSAWIGGLFLVLGFTGLAVLFATLFNLITDLVGGMRFTVLEEEVVEARPSPLRQFIERRLDPGRPVIGRDGSSPSADADADGDAHDAPH